MDIDSMLNKYFEGETTHEEEHLLITYFNQENLPEHLKELRPMFTYLDDERVARDALMQIEHSVPQSFQPIKRKLILNRSFFISAIVAASIIAAFFLFSPNNNSFPEVHGSYAWINGIHITNKEEVKMIAEKSFENVSSNENIFMEQMNAVFEENNGGE